MPGFEFDTANFDVLGGVGLWAMSSGGAQTRLGPAAPYK